jgi:glycosyltransferase involved in cell wall biosynthesis
MISIVIPTWNEGKVIRKTLEHLEKGLKTTPHEIIVADDGSTDKTQSIARRCGAVISGAKNKTRISCGKNRGAFVAKGEYLAFIDADVTIKDPKKFFQRAIDNFESNPRLVGLGCYIRVLPNLETKEDIVFRTILNNFNYFMNNVLHLGTGSGEFQMVSKDAFRKIGGFDERIVASEDYDLFSRLSKVGETRFDTSLTVYEEGRRAHSVGWLKLFPVWILNGLMVIFFKRSMSKEWKEIR